MMSYFEGQKHEI